ncbi:MAG: glycosyltransferase [Bacteroidota bacterium]
MRNRALKIIISGGGTGGHIYPAVAVAQEIQRKRYALSFAWELITVKFMKHSAVMWI